jgi:hypothetical protein
MTGAPVSFNAGADGGIRFQLNVGAHTLQLLNMHETIFKTVSVIMPTPSAMAFMAVTGLAYRSGKQDTVRYEPKQPWILPCISSLIQSSRL